MTHYQDQLAHLIKFLNYTEEEAIIALEEEGITE